MGLFSKNKKEKPTQEERVLRTRIDLEKLRDRYEVLLETQRRILRKNITQKEKDEAEAKIRAGICSYTIVNEALRDLDEITSDIELTNSLKGLNRSLKAVNKLGRKASPGFFTKLSLDRQVSKMQKRDENNAPEKIYNGNSLSTVDEWLGSKWDHVARSYINGDSLEDCLKDSRVLLESDPIPELEAYSEIFGEAEEKKGGEELSAEDDLRELLNSDIF